MAYKKYVKKAIAYTKKKTFGSKGITGRYGIGKGKGGLNISNIAKDLAMVKSRLNVEKKWIEGSVVSDTFAQINLTSEGAFYIDITQPIPQGTGENNRIGNSIKMTGLSIPIQFSGQQNTLSSRKIRISLLRVKAADNGVTAQEAFEKVWDVNPLTGTRDFNAPRAYRSSKTDGIAIVRSMTCYLPAPSLDNGAIGTVDTEQAQKSVKFAVKLKDLLRWNSNADTLPNGIKYILVFQADVGNESAITSGLAQAPVKTAFSGMAVRFYHRYWYVDN